MDGWMAIIGHRYSKGTFGANEDANAGVIENGLFRVRLTIRRGGGAS